MIDCKPAGGLTGPAASLFSIFTEDFATLARFQETQNRIRQEHSHTYAKTCTLEHKGLQ